MTAKNDHAEFYLVVMVVAIIVLTILGLLASSRII